jgi:small subunit ribosomal protein S10
MLKLRITIKSYSKSSIQQVDNEIKLLLSQLNLTFKRIQLPIKKKLFCLLRSPHIDKDSREQLGIFFYKICYDIDKTTIYLFDELIYKKVPANVTYTLKILSNKYSSFIYN